MRLEVRLQQDTLWLNLNQMAALFERDKSVISRHLRKIFEEGDLEREATVAFFATVQREGKREVVRQVELYNLDAIISVGYRVNSGRSTQFRIWATQLLKDHLLKGYTVNEQRLAQLRQTIRLIADASHRRSLTGDEAAALLDLLRDYSFALNLLDDFDHGRLPRPKGGRLRGPTRLARGGPPSDRRVARAVGCQPAVWPRERRGARECLGHRVPDCRRAGC